MSIRLDRCSFDVVPLYLPHGVLSSSRQGTKFAKNIIIPGLHCRYDPRSHARPCKQNSELPKIEDLFIELDDFVELFFFHGAQHDAGIASDQVRRIGLDVLAHRNPLYAAERFLAFA